MPKCIHKHFGRGARLILTKTRNESTIGNYANCSNRSDGSSAVLQESAIAHEQYESEDGLDNMNGRQDEMGLRGQYEAEELHRHEEQYEVTDTYEDLREAVRRAPDNVIQFLLSACMSSCGPLVKFVRVGVCSQLSEVLHHNFASITALREQLRTGVECDHILRSPFFKHMRRLERKSNDLRLSGVLSVDGVAVPGTCRKIWPVSTMIADLTMAEMQQCSNVLLIGIAECIENPFTTFWNCILPMIMSDCEHENVIVNGYNCFFRCVTVSADQPGIFSNVSRGRQFAEHTGNDPSNYESESTSSKIFSDRIGNYLQPTPQFSHSAFEARAELHEANAENYGHANNDSPEDCEELTPLSNVHFDYPHSHPASSSMYQNDGNYDSQWGMLSTPRYMKNRLSSSSPSKPNGPPESSSNGRWHPIGFGMANLYNKETATPYSREICDENFRKLTRTDKETDYYPFLNLASKFHGRDEYLEQMAVGMAYHTEHNLIIPEHGFCLGAAKIEEQTIILPSGAAFKLSEFLAPYDTNRWSSSSFDTDAKSLLRKVFTKVADMDRYFPAYTSSDSSTGLYV
ncbi:unnamed protein product [Caenorhabditis sp. 36 PRJEB53466]|nr:unnamed protein product [Caenorhabditis sp. 36 PRJEB53466]